MRLTVISESHELARMFLRANRVKLEDALVVVDANHAHGRDFSGVTFVVGSPHPLLMREVRRRADASGGSIRYVNTLDKVT